MSFLLHLLRPNDLFVDVGANVGAYSLLSAGVCKSTTIAIEPSPKAYQNLLLNLRINNLSDIVKTHKIGIGSKETVAFLNLSTAGNMSYVTMDGYSTNDLNEIELHPLDKIVSDGNPILVKIDVEGYEYQVLSGMKRILSSSTLKAIIIEFNASGIRYGVEDSDLHKKLLNYGFLPYTYFPFERRLQSLSSYRRDVFNTIYFTFR